MTDYIKTMQGPMNVIKKSFHTSANNIQKDGSLPGLIMIKQAKRNSSWSSVDHTHHLILESAGDTLLRNV